MALRWTGLLVSPLAMEQTNPCSRRRIFDRLQKVQLGHFHFAGEPTSPSYLSSGTAT